MKKELTELISYIFVGGCTTLVNFIVYFLLISYLGTSWLVANVISWVAAVMFAYFANKQFVFKSHNDSIQEAYQFFILRLLTLVVESSLLFIFIQLCGVNEMVSKVVVSVITVVSNYGLCKFKIFAS
ncbi:GtrA family protein [uncultured Thomasclavelia sp.]|uniref:GtrA family protein n=1 Tax=uncultured Thomasclavelia sp. TaxID=3025759 RepID=UPI0025E6B79D|nr:GtrA family protein [uncultured Thomasclavelia sp.]